MSTLRGSRTERNLLTSFAGESQARNRYTYFAGKARKEGFVQIAAVFEETAEQEKEHAKRFFSFLEGGEVTIEYPFPAGTIGDTLQNLRTSAAGEHHEHTEMYRQFAAVAREEGFGRIADLWERVSVAERYHETRYSALADNLEAGRVFARSESVTWRCRNCGYLHEGTQAPELCPACAHPQAYFELYVPTW